MRKILLVSILGGLLSVGCIDNSAIQKLNDSAEKYLNQSETSKAVCMLEASKELNPNIYETRYNLGVAYIELNDYKNAVSEINEAIKIKNDNPNSYYTLGVAYEGLGYSILDKYKNENVLDDNDDKVASKLTEDETNEGLSALENAVDSYKTYLEKNQNADDKENVENQIESIKNKIEKVKKGDE